MPELPEESEETKPPHPYAVWFSDQIELAMRERGWRLEDLSTHTGYSKSYLWAITHRRSLLNVDVLEKIAEALGIDWLLLLHARIQEKRAKEGALVPSSKARRGKALRPPLMALRQTRQQLQQDQQRLRQIQRHHLTMACQRHEALRQTLHTTQRLCHGIV